MANRNPKSQPITVSDLVLPDISAHLDSEGTLTPYKVIARLLNPVLAVLELDEKPTQMGYNYASKGLIETVAPNRVSAEVALAWAAEFAVKRYNSAHGLEVEVVEETTETESSETTPEVVEVS